MPDLKPRPRSVTGTRAVPYLFAYLGLYLALTYACAEYVARHNTNNVLARIDRLERVIVEVRAALEANGTGIETNRLAGEADRVSGREDRALIRENRRTAVQKPEGDPP